MLGVGAAFSFLGMMFNVPLVGGATGHAVGGTLIALPFPFCGIMGTTLLRSTEMSRQMYEAMQCRGFTDDYRGL